MVPDGLAPGQGPRVRRRGSAALRFPGESRNTLLRSPDDEPTVPPLRPHMVAEDGVGREMLGARVDVFQLQRWVRVSRRHPFLPGSRSGSAAATGAAGLEQRSGRPLPSAGDTAGDDERPFASAPVRSGPNATKRPSELPIT